MTALPTLGTTLYSFTPEFHAYKYTFPELVRTVADAGIGPALEFVGFQSIKGFPAVSDEFSRTFRGLIDETGLVPSCLAINVDLGRRRDRFLTDDEMVEFMTVQIEAARELGFPVARVQNLASPDVMERLAPVAEKNDVKLGMELHAPSTVRAGWAATLLERYEKVGSPYLGFIPDFGASTRTLAPSLFEEFTARGVSQQVQDEVRETYAQGKLIYPLIEGFSKRGEPAAARVFATGASLFGHMDVEEWRDIVPWTVHIHGKFYDIDENGDEPTIDYKSILRIFVEGGYTGTISSEWEAWHWVSNPDARAMIQKHQAMERRYLQEITAPIAVSS